MQGTTVGITSGRKASQLAAALERRGFEVVVGPCVGGDVAEPDEAVVAATDAIVQAEPDWLVASTGVGMRTWIEVAARSGRLDGLRELARSTPWVARGAKAVGGLKGLEVEPVWVPEGETDAEVVAWLLGRTSRGETVGVQLHGSDTEHPYGELADAGVELLTVLPYRSTLPEDRVPAEALARDVADGRIDVVTFTSPGAVRGLLSIADDAGLGEDVRAAMRAGVSIASIGHVTTGALRHAGLEPTLEPERHRTGALVEALTAWAEGR